MNHKLRNELLKMMSEDQEMCKTKWDLAVHKKHMNKIKKIVNNFGWPDSDLVGQDGANAVWLLVQHCDEDVEFQKRCLQLMIQAVKKKSGKPGRCSVSQR